MTAARDIAPIYSLLFSCRGRVCLLFGILFYCLSSNSLLGAEMKLALSLTRAPEKTVWKVSEGLASAYHQYYDVPAWNCDGSKLMFASLQGSNQMYVVSGLEDPPQVVHLASAGSRREDDYVQWDRKDPNVFYYFKVQSGVRTLYRQSLNGQREVLFTINSIDYRLAPPHPDGKHLLLHPSIGKSNPSLIFSLLSNSVLHTVPMPGNVHRVRFTKASDLTIFCNLEGQSARYVVAVDGSANAFFPDQAAHPDFNDNGTLFSFFQSGSSRGLYIHSLATGATRRIAGNDTSFGHQSWSYDGRYILADINNDRVGPHRNFILEVDSFDDSVRRVIRHDSIYLEGGAAQTTHPHVFASPDTTKAVFNVNPNPKTAQPHVFVVQLRKPLGVHSAELEKVAGGSTIVRWALPPSAERSSVLLKELNSRDEVIWSHMISGSATSINFVPEASTSRLEIQTREHSGLLSEASILYLSQVGVATP